MSQEEKELTLQQYFDIINPNVPYEVRSDGHVRIEQFSILSDDESKYGSRVTIMAHVLSNTSDKRGVVMDVAISSFILGQDFDRTCNLIIAPSDKCTLNIIGGDVQVQMIYSLFTD